jgi:porin
VRRGARGDAGGRQSRLRHFDNVGLDITLDLGKLWGWSGAGFHTSFAWRGGESLSDRDIGNVFNVAQECCDPTYRFVNGGLVYRGPFPGRSRDVAAVGAVHGRFSEDLRRSQRDARRTDPTAPAPQTWELALELTYIIEVAPWLQVQPDVQVILNPGGTGRIPDALVLGVQVSVNF